MNYIKELFWPTKEPTPEQMAASRCALLAQGALAAVMYNLGTGNFLAGYLGALGASAAQISRILAIPQLGCVLQLASPFFFERKVHRKASITALCFLFRFSMGFMVFAPFLFASKGGRLAFATFLYGVSFLLAGFVTPALNQWIMQIAPEANRGRYFAVKEVIASVVNAAVAFIMGRQLDVHTALGIPMKGYTIVYGFCIVGAVVDLILMSIEREPATPALPKVRASDLAAPLRERRFRPVLVYELMSYTSSSLSSGFLSVYQLTVLGLNHTFITSIGIVTALIGIGSIWVWGRVADRTYWTTVLLGTRALSTLCLFMWWLLPVGWALYAAPLIMAISAAAGGAAMAGVNLQYDSSPAAGKTAYLGVTAALGSITGYGAALLGSQIQHHLEPLLGGRSIAVLFAASGILSIVTICYGAAHLPRAPVCYRDPPVYPPDAETAP